MYLRTSPPPPVEQADMFFRATDMGIGQHCGTGLSNGMIQTKMPETGRVHHTLDQFSTGKPVLRVRPRRTPEEKAMVEYRALTNPTSPFYNGASGNCEHDWTYAQFGVAISPTANNVMLALGAVAVIGILGMLGNSRN